LGWRKAVSFYSFHTFIVAAFLRRPTLIRVFVHLSSVAIVSYLFLMDLIEIKALSPEDFEEIAVAFGKLGWSKPRSQYEAYYAEQTAGVRSVLIARLKGEFAGYVTIKWIADYTLFLTNYLPEIQDLNVLPTLSKEWSRRTSDA